MEISNQISKIGIIKDWNKSLDGKICIVISEKNISYNTRYDICKVLIDSQIHTVPKYFIKTCTNSHFEL